MTDRVDLDDLEKNPGRVTFRDVPALIRELREARAALAFYADPANHDEREQWGESTEQGQRMGRSPVSWMASDVQEDRGTRARQALGREA